MSGLPAELSTARLRLRAPAASDAAALFEGYTQDPEVARFMVWKPHADLAATEAFVEWCCQSWRDGKARPYVITEAGADRAIGMLEARPQGTRVDLGYVLARSAWGRGYMPEAVTALADLALREPGVFRVQATCHVDNLASQRVLERSGFAREGRLARWLVLPNLSPEPQDSFMYARVR